jgi:hypothetical protein
MRYTAEDAIRASEDDDNPIILLPTDIDAILLAHGHELAAYEDYCVDMARLGKDRTDAAQLFFWLGY